MIIGDVAEIARANDLQLNTLHRISLELVRERSLQGVLQHIADGARELVEAQYAAIGVPGSDGTLERFVTSGVSAAEAAAIGAPPRGHGLLGAIVRGGRAIRLEDIVSDPRSVGFPAHHPYMKSFLGVPILSQDRGIGHIYLTNKREGAGFGDRDQQLVEMLAAYAAVAIENARYYQRLSQDEAQLEDRNRELAILNEIAHVVGTSLDPEVILEKTLSRVMGLFEAEVGEIFLDEEGTNEFSVVLRKGTQAPAFLGHDHFRLGEDLVGSAAKQKELIFSSSLSSEPRLPRHAAQAGFGTYLCIPLVSKDRVLGVMGLAALRPIELTPRLRDLYRAVGLTMGEAVENGLLHRKSQRLAVLEERERIGMDLHDGIIQSIYAVGLMLEDASLSLHEDPRSAREKMAKSVEGLNGVIRDIRSYILDLQPRRMATENLAAGLRQLVREFRAQTLTEVDLHILNGAAEGLSAASMTSLFHVTQEALANVAKHSEATHVVVNLRRNEEWIELTVNDNGKGFSTEGQRKLLGHGLTNIEERARAAGGEATIHSERGKGTVVRVRIPAVVIPAGPA
ncbi:MAG: GAF domain-containing sensor histidine kinase [Anaerolineales bacterium]